LALPTGLEIKPLIRGASVDSHRMGEGRSSGASRRRPMSFTQAADQ
jgi:hypothetical protein